MISRSLLGQNVGDFFGLNFVVKYIDDLGNNVRNNFRNNFGIIREQFWKQSLEGCEADVKLSF